MEDKRARILQAVWTVAASGGIAAVSVRAVAAAAGVSPGLVQHHFPTKQALVHASAQHMVAVAGERHHDALVGVPPATELRTILTHAIPQAAASPAGTSVYYSFVAAGVADPGLGAVLAEAKRGTTARVAELLAELSGAHDPARAVVLQAVADGAALGVLLGSLTPAEALSAVEVALAATLGSG